ncbi:hypothetical protein [Streptomyces lomondensis]|nr:hypothetical protein [Streptomyces lomondensis]MCF0080094.1 hypothetical protein [Streptomyces lomondensis]
MTAPGRRGHGGETTRPDADDSDAPAPAGGAERRFDLMAGLRNAVTVLG